MEKISPRVDLAFVWREVTDWIV